MKKILTALIFLFYSLPIGAEEYIVIGWNDLGMHCANKSFAGIAVLPPYNNLMAQVIKKGDLTTRPAVITNKLKITYEIPGNTYSVGKTDFWTFCSSLFNANLQPNIGLTGLGLTGTMTDKGGYFRAEGIPLTPYTDADLLNEDPFQLALIKVFDSKKKTLTTTKTVIPVSNEIGCVSDGCHGSEKEIFDGHYVNHSPTPPMPLLCASCHSSNALGAPGKEGVWPLSQAIHHHHSEVDGINCYNCHPGTHVKCLRDTMSTFGLFCTDCHGQLMDIAVSIENGRQPWLQEPRCGNAACHGKKGPQYNEEPEKLFRQSKGHGGLYCSACHGSPHAIVPTRTDRDNQQNLTLQGVRGTLRCWVCHGYTPTGRPGPHGIIMPDLPVATLGSNLTSMINVFTMSGVLNSGNGNAFMVKLKGAIDNINKKQYLAGVNLLGAFINLSEAFRGKQLTEAQANELAAEARDIIYAVSKIQGSAKPAAQPELPKAFSLSQNSPNPFNPYTTIQYSIPGNKEVSIRIKVYDIRGDIVKTLVDGESEPGKHSVTWNATDDEGKRISSGIYIYKLEAGSFTQTRKMLLLR
jgi:hypothetical protein